jgi:hypothetical protein
LTRCFRFSRRIHRFASGIWRTRSRTIYDRAI